MIGTRASRISARARPSGMPPPIAMREIQIVVQAPARSVGTAAWSKLSAYSWTDSDPLLGPGQLLVLLEAENRLGREVRKSLSKPLLLEFGELAGAAQMRNKLGQIFEKIVVAARHRPGVEPGAGDR